MNRPLPRALVRTSSAPDLGLWLDRLLLVCFVGSWGLAMVRLFPDSPLMRGASWPDAILLVSALLTTASALTLQTPLQNTALACAVIAVIGGTAHWMSHLTGVPFGPLQLPQVTDSGWLQEWMFALASLWIVVVLNARGVARLLLEPWRRSPNRGLHLLGLTTLLVLVLALALEPFATLVQRYWLWGTTRLPFTWHGAPVSALFGWGAVSLICGIAATPALIDKHPHPAPPSLRPLLMWAMLNAWFALGCATHGLWDVTLVAVINGVVPAIFVALSSLRSTP